MIFLDMHLLPGIFRKHLAAIGCQESPEDIGPVLLQGLWLSPRTFPELFDELELDEQILFLVARCGFQGGDLLTLKGYYALQGRNAILEGRLR